MNVVGFRGFLIGSGLLEDYYMDKNAPEKWYKVKNENIDKVVACMNRVQNRENQFYPIFVRDCGDGFSLVIEG